MSPQSVHSADNTLIIQPLPGIGDMIWQLPFIHAIAGRTASGKVTLLSKRRSRADQLFAYDPSIAEILWLERTGAGHDDGHDIHGGIAGIWRLARRLREHRFQCVWILHHSSRYALIGRLAGITRRIGYGSRGQCLWLSRGMHLPPDRLPRHPIAAGQQLLNHLGITDFTTEPRLVLDPQRRNTVRQKWLAAAPDVHIVLGIGSSEAFKQWPKERFVELMQRLQQEKNCRFYLFGGGAGEQALAGWIESRARALGLEVVNALDITIDEAMHLLSLADCYIGNDTGFLNIAAALAIPSVGIFGASPPLQYSASIHPVVPPQGALSDYERSGRGIVSISTDAVYRAIRELDPAIITPASPRLEEQP